MLNHLILAVAMAGQAPERIGPVQPAPRPAKAEARPAARPIPRPHPAPVAADERAQLIARRKAKRAAAFAREARAAQEQARAEEQAKKEAMEMMPYLLEARRQDFERQADIERNVLRNRAVGALERRAGYVYPGQSPTQGPFR
jgi:hypothetical protein